MSDPLESLESALYVVIVIGVLIVGGLSTLYILRAQSRKLEEDTAFYLDKHQDYFAYLSINIDGPGALLPPPGPLAEAELKAIQKKLLEWIETIEGAHRGKLTKLCRDMGLVELERERLASKRHWDRIDAAYHLGIMRAPECTGELINLLEQEAEGSTAFVVARAAAKCASEHGELRRLALRLAKHHPQSHQLIADIIASSALDPTHVYLDLLQSNDAELINIALIGVSGRSESALFPVLERLASSEHKEVRIKASKQLLEYTHLMPQKRIEGLIYHPDWEIRAAAIKTAGLQKLPVFTDALKRGLSDDSWWVRHYSAKSLAQLGLDGFRVLCEAASGANNAQSRDTAWDAIHDELERAAVLASRDFRHILHFNELSHMYETIFNEPYASHPVKMLPISS
ncbi:HEAT repeat domain-containing protein [Paenibacillus xerothermodurans]|nr:HEAT repeat domain-containing protein [Paenibacillus xerothermodurans]